MFFRDARVEGKFPVECRPILAWSVSAAALTVAKYFDGNIPKFLLFKG